MFAYAQSIRNKKTKPYRFLATVGLGLFLIVSIISIIPITSNINLVTLKLNEIDNNSSRIYKNINDLEIDYSFKKIEYKSKSNYSIEVLGKNGERYEYKFPIICEYNQTYNMENYNICSETNLDNTLPIINSIILLNCGVTVCSIAFIIVELIIEFKILKQLDFQQKKHFKIWAIAFRLSFIIPTLFSILSMSIFLTSFPSSVSLKYNHFNSILLSSSSSNNPWKHDNGLITNLFTMLLSIIASLCLISSFYILYKKYKRAVYYSHDNNDGYSLLYV